MTKMKLTNIYFLRISIYTIILFIVNYSPNTLAQDALHALSIDICGNPHPADSHIIDCSGKNVALEDFEKMNQIRGATHIDFRFSKSSSWDQLSNLDLPHLESIAFQKTNIVDFPDISHIVSLRSIESTQDDIKEIKVDVLPCNLEKISLTRSLINHLDFIQGTPHLKVLYVVVHRSPTFDLKGISYAKNLDSFSFNFGKPPKETIDITSLSGLRNLKELNIDPSEVTDISPIGQLTSLEVLSLLNGKTEDSLMLKALLKSLIRLKSLSISEVAGENLDSFQDLELMERLHVLDGASLKSLYGIEKMKKLRDLRIERLKGADLSLIAGLAQLEVLTLSGDISPDLSFLSGLKSLKRITLESDSLSDVTALLRCDNLEEINIDRTKITDINPLIGLKRLKVIYADRAPISWETTDPALLEKIYRHKALP